MVPWGHGDCSLWWGFFAWVLRVKICGLAHKQDSGTFQWCYQNVLTSAFVAFTVEFPTECGHLFLGLISNRVKVVKGLIWRSEVKNQKILECFHFLLCRLQSSKNQIIGVESRRERESNPNTILIPTLCDWLGSLVFTWSYVTESLSGIRTSFPRDCDVLCFWWQILLCYVPSGGTWDFKWQGWWKDFFGFEIFDSRIFLGTKIWLG